MPKTLVLHERAVRERDEKIEKVVALLYPPKNAAPDSFGRAMGRVANSYVSLRRAGTRMRLRGLVKRYGLGFLDAIAAHEKETKKTYQLVLSYSASIEAAEKIRPGVVRLIADTPLVLLSGFLEELHNAEPNRKQWTGILDRWEARVKKE